MSMIYTNDVPYLTLFPKSVALPKGEPHGKGVLIYYYAESVMDTIKYINDKTNFFDTSSAYKYYFYNAVYTGKLRGKPFYKKELDERRVVYDKVKEETNLNTVPALTLKTFGRNCYVELSRYFQIYHQIMDQYHNFSKIEIFWKYLSSVINDSNTLHYNQKLLIINADDYANAFKGSIRDRLNNPLFMIYYTMLKTPEFVKDFNTDIFIYSGKKIIRLDLTKIELNKTASKFKYLLTRLLPSNANDIMNATEVDTINKEEIGELSAIKVDTSLRFNVNEEEPVSFNTMPTPLGDKPQVKLSAKEVLTKEINAKIDEKIDQVAKSNIDPKDASAKVDEEIEKDKELLEKLYNQAVADNHPVSSASSARDKQIREEQGKIAVGNMTIDKLRSIQSTHMPIPSTDISKSIKTTNENMKKVTFKNFEKTYNENVFPKDMVNAFASLNDKSIPLTIIKYDVKDTSDELNYKDTYTVTFEDVNRQRHTITVDIPKFIDDRFMWIGGSKKLILYQNFLYPVVKSGPDEVQIVTNYNKMFIARFGTKSITSLERLNKLISVNSEVAKYFSSGYAYKLNGDYITTVEYDELSKKFTKFECGDTVIFFNQEEAQDEAEDAGISIGDKEIFIGFHGKTAITIDQDTQQTGEGKSITDIIIEALDPKFKEEFEKIKAPKRLLYSVATTMKQPVALGMLLGFWEGLSSVLKNLKLEFRLEPSAPKQLKSNESMIRFKDCYLVYTENVSQSLVMNGFRIIKTEMYNITEMETKEPYMDYLVKVYGKRSIANALMNTYEFTIDPITKEILEDLHLPTTLVPLCIYANSLLSDSQYTADYNQKLCRIRSSEIIPSILYDAIAKQYVVFKNSNGKKKLSLQRDIVIKKLLDLKTVEDYSTLNPILEMERTHTTMYKGWRGINSDHTYTQDKRVYDNSMVGIIGPSTSPDGSVGVQKTLTMEPNVVSARGYLKAFDGDTKELKDINLFSPSEMLTPLAVTRDDPTRTGHSIKQSKHVIPVLHSSPVLISNGMEESVRYSLSSDFVINAKDDGEVVEINDELGLIICKYKNGTTQAISLNPKIEKNGGGGFYLSNHLITNLTVGSKFKKNDLLAWHKDFFKNSNYNSGRMNMGTLVKVAIMSNYNTYQDSTVITEKMSHEMSTEMVFNRQVVIGKNATVDFIASVGDKIEVGSSLIQFDTSYEDNELNKLLESLSSELQEGIAENSRNNIQSKIGGVIEDIKMYSTVELGELSPSLQKIFGKYYKKINEKKKLLDKYDPNNSIVKCGMLIDETTGKISPNKYGVVKGQKVEDGVLIEFYIKHEESLEIGSKVA